MNESKWRKFLVQENLEDFKMSLLAMAGKAADEMGAMPPKLGKPGKFGSRYMIFPFDPGSPGAALTAMGQRTMSGQRRDISMEKAKNAANRFISYVAVDGSPVDQGALGIDETGSSFKVFLAPL
tara:strand:- start:1123 stop:1494 length:372 start_codon:yes stop_codon:yes gene_type:complete